MQSVRRSLLLVLIVGFAVTTLPVFAQQVIATVPVGQSPDAVAVNPVTNKVYVANQCGNDPTCASNGTVTVIDGATLSTQTVPVGAHPQSVAVNSATNKIYVVNHCGNDPTCNSSGTVTVIDGISLSTQTVPVGILPYSAVLNSVTNKIYVTSDSGESPGTLTAIDGATLSTQTVLVGIVPDNVAVNSVTNKIYLVNACSYDEFCRWGTLWVIDGVTLGFQDYVDLRKAPRVVDVNPVTNKVYVTNVRWCGGCLDGGVVVIDGTTLAAQIVVVGFYPNDVRVNSVTNKIYVANRCGDDRDCNSSGTVTAIDGATNGTTSVAVGDGPTVLAINSATNRIYVPNMKDNTVSIIADTGGLQFVALTPCRVVDTRPLYGGGGPIQGGTHQNFPISGVPLCGIPSSAAAYSMNVSVVPQGPLGYLTVWPTGKPQPLVSTLNSLDGRIKANAAIVPAGTSGDVSVYATQTTNVILDVNGYFTPVSSSTLAFYPLPPCRVADTRKDNFPPGLGSPFLTGLHERDFPILNATSCNIPSNAAAYSLNFSVVPHGPLGYMTVWPTGESRPTVSTLNDIPGTIIANAAIVVAGTGGEVSVYPSNDTDLIIDINGYFAATGTGGLSLYGVQPCRVIDTRNVGTGLPFTGTLSPPVDVVDTGCAASSLAQAYVFNASVVPYGILGYLTLWPDDGSDPPLVSTLNALDGSISSNMAIVPTSNGSVNAYASGTTQLILDLSSYFAP